MAVWNIFYNDEEKTYNKQAAGVITLRPKNEIVCDAERKREVDVRNGSWREGGGVYKREK